MTANFIETFIAVLTIFVLPTAIAMIVASAVNLICMARGKYDTSQCYNGVRGVLRHKVRPDLLEAATIASNVVFTAWAALGAMEAQYYTWTVFFTVGTVLCVWSCHKEAQYK